LLVQPWKSKIQRLNGGSMWWDCDFEGMGSVSWEEVSDVEINDRYIQMNKLIIKLSWMKKEEKSADNSNNFCAFLKYELKGTN
jgi:hypothetical protein